MSDENTENPRPGASEHPLNPNRWFYDQLRTPPEDALKKIGGGRLKGKTDISPQWRWDRMTAVFGPMGFGWTWEIVERWTHVCANEEVMAFVRGQLKVSRPVAGGGSEWSAPIFGMGGSMLVELENSGQLHNNDEAWKMAETDALGNACKYLGLAADVYRGMMDGSKYEREKPERSNAAPQGPPARLCPKCNGPMYDNTTGPKPYANSPDFKCKDPKCAHKVWLQAGETPKPAAQPAGPQAPLKPVMPAASAAPAGRSASALVVTRIGGETHWTCPAHGVVASAPAGVEYFPSHELYEAHATCKPPPRAPAPQPAPAAPAAAAAAPPPPKAKAAPKAATPKPAPARSSITLKEMAIVEEGYAGGRLMPGETAIQYLDRLDREEAAAKAPPAAPAGREAVVKHERGPDGRYPRGPSPETDPWCPDCGGPMHDMRATRKNPKAPEWICQMAVVMAPNCEGARWPRKADGGDDAASA